MSDFLTYVTLEGVSGDDLLTLQEAADELGVTPQRVNQMLGKRLEGPKFDGRAPKGVGRVYRSSLDDEIRRRREAPAAAAPKMVPNVPHNLPSAVDLRSREAAVRAAAFELKAVADAARAELARDRDQVEVLQRENAELLVRIDRLERHFALEKTAADGYSDALTQLLGPLTPEEV